MQSITFTEQLILTLTDKVAIGLVLAFVGFWLNKKLDDFKSQQTERLEALKGEQAVQLQLLAGEQAAWLKVMEGQQALAKEFRDLQTQKELQVTAQIASARLPAYKAIWEIQEMVSPTLHPDLKTEQRKELETKLRTSFFKDGNGIFLSHSALTSYRAAMKCLKDNEAESNQIIDAFSDLRKRMKEDLKIYNEEEASAPTLRKSGT